MSGPKKPKRKKPHDISAEISFHIDLGEIDVNYKGVEKKKPAFVKPEVKKQKGREGREEKH